MNDGAGEEDRDQLRSRIARVLHVMANGVVLGFHITKTRCLGPELFVVLRELLEQAEAGSVDEGKSIVRAQLRLLRSLQYYSSPSDPQSFVSREQIEAYCEWLRSVGYSNEVG